MVTILLIAEYMKFLAIDKLNLICAAMLGLLCCCSRGCMSLLVYNDTCCSRARHDFSLREGA